MLPEFLAILGIIAFAITGAGFAVVGVAVYGDLSGIGNPTSYYIKGGVMIMAGLALWQAHNFKKIKFLR